MKSAQLRALERQKAKQLGREMAVMAGFVNGTEEYDAYALGFQTGFQWRAKEMRELQAKLDALRKDGLAF